MLRKFLSNKNKEPQQYAERINESIIIAVAEASFHSKYKTHQCYSFNTKVNVCTYTHTERVYQERRATTTTENLSHYQNVVLPLLLCLWFCSQLNLLQQIGKLYGNRIFNALYETTSAAAV